MVRLIDHLARTFRRYLAHRGYQQAASITYFSVLSLIPVAMVVLSAAGYVFSGHPGLLDQLRTDITEGVPAATGCSARCSGRSGCTRPGYRTSVSRSGRC